MNQPAQNVVREEPARFTIEEFATLADAAAAADIVDRLELIEGVIARVPPALLPHMKIVNDLGFALRRLLEESGSDLTAYCETGLQFGADTLRQPDIMVFKLREGRRYVEPSEVLVAIEVADTTLRRDLGPRKLRFAEAGVPHYWVVDIEGERVHRFAVPKDGDYAEHVEQGFDAPLPVPGSDATVTLA